MKRPLLILGSSLWLLALIFAFLPSWPHIYYRLSPNTSESLAQVIGQDFSPAKDGSEPVPERSEEQLFETSSDPQPAQLPPTNPSLPAEPGLIIENIGVRGEIHQGDAWQEILKQGIWQVPNFGTPEENQKPIILAAHRWGYLNWTSQFRHLNSFYNLPKLKIGDQVKINYNQRQYIYEIKAEELGEKISDYSFDLILYTCQLWDSPIRIFKYAQRIN